MKKDFNKWNEEKKNIHELGTNKLYHTRDIWWCSFGVNVGFEQDGKNTDFQRPILILKGFSPNTCLVAPLTTSEEKHKYRIPVGLVAGKTAKAIISQIKIVDTKRLVNKIAVLDEKTFEIIRKSIKDLL